MEYVAVGSWQSAYTCCHSQFAVLNSQLIMFLRVTCAICTWNASSSCVCFTTFGIEAIWRPGLIVWSICFSVALLSHGQIIYDFFWCVSLQSRNRLFNVSNFLLKIYVHKLKAYLACKQNNRPIPKRQHVATDDSLRRHVRLTSSSHGANISV